MFGMLEANLERERIEIIKKGKKEKALEIAKRMLKEKMPAELIIRITQVTEEDLEVLETQ